MPNSISNTNGVDEGDPNGIEFPSFTNGNAAGHVEGRNGIVNNVEVPVTDDTHFRPIHRRHNRQRLRDVPYNRSAQRGENDIPTNNYGDGGTPETNGTPIVEATASQPGTIQPDHVRPGQRRGNARNTRHLFNHPFNCAVQGGEGDIATNNDENTGTPGSSVAPRFEDEVQTNQPYQVRPEQHRRYALNTSCRFNYSFNRTVQRGNEIATNNDVNAGTLGPSGTLTQSVQVRPIQSRPYDRNFMLRCIYRHLDEDNNPTDAVSDFPSSSGAPLVEATETQSESNQPYIIRPLPVQCRRIGRNLYTRPFHHFTQRGEDDNRTSNDGDAGPAEGNAGSSSAFVAVATLPSAVRETSRNSSVEIISLMRSHLSGIEAAPQQQANVSHISVLIEDINRNPVDMQDLLELERNHLLRKHNLLIQVIQAIYSADALLFGPTLVESSVDRTLVNYTNDDNQTACVICKKAVMSQNPTALPCGHLFCGDCAEKLRRERLPCPVCFHFTPRRRFLRLF